MWSERKFHILESKAGTLIQTLSSTTISTHVRDNTNWKKKKLFQVDYKDLQVAHISANFKAELQV